MPPRLTASGPSKKAALLISGRHVLLASREYAACSSRSSTYGASGDGSRTPAYWAACYSSSCTRRRRWLRVKPNVYRRVNANSPRLTLMVGKRAQLWDCLQHDCKGKWRDSPPLNRVGDHHESASCFPLSRSSGHRTGCRQCRPGQRIDYPKTRRVDHVDTYFGVKVTTRIAGWRPTCALAGGGRLGGGREQADLPLSGVDPRSARRFAAG